jgi:photoactive yellow protein
MDTALAGTGQAPASLKFADPDAFERLEAMTDDELDALPFGVVGMDGQGYAIRYNRHESELAGLSQRRVIGRPFFPAVAPCMDNAVVAERFAEDAIDEHVDYVLTLQMQPVPVTLRLLKARRGGPMYVLVRRREPSHG